MPTAMRTGATPRRSPALRTMAPRAPHNGHPRPWNSRAGTPRNGRAALLQGPPRALYASEGENFAAARCWVRSQRTVLVAARMMTVWVSTRPPANFTPLEQRAVGDAGRGEDDVAASPSRSMEYFGDRSRQAHGVGALALVLAQRRETPQHLAADAAQRGRGQHALGRAADADIHVDAGFGGIDGLDDAGDVAVADQVDGGAGRAHLVDQLGVARAVENAHGQVGDARRPWPRPGGADFRSG